ncbi:DUF6777 domain-containing protein [Streptomyces sp. NPDC058326]|uniref:DUF6777 domain-containing protein n=1 Tax=Streptomyces sp. NPDC058326 TaxID=3346447 RepID=UPI0036E91876
MGAERKKGKNVTSHPPSGPPSGPPSVPPAGPPSGPLSGPSTRPGTAGPPPPPGPPYDGSGGGPGGGGSSGGSGSGGGSSRAEPPGGGDRGPWWRSVPKVASVTAVVVAAAALAVVLTNRPDGGGSAGSGGGEVFLQNAAAAGPDPFTPSTARTGDASASPASLPPRTAPATTEMSGSTPGLYGGTKAAASCDVEQQVRYLSGEPAKNAAFASVVGVSAGDVPRYLRSLTPLQLRVDTRVTNHGFRDGSATSYQAVLQAGTAVLVDGRGLPRVRCACGNPLTDPVPQKAPRTTGTPWQGYSSSRQIVVTPSVTVVNVFVVYDPEDDGWFARRHGDTGRHDKPAPPPPPLPSASPSTSATSPSPPTSASTSPSTPTSSPPTSPPDTSPSTDTSPPDSSPSTESPAPESAPESAPVTETSADLTTSESTDRSASVSSPASGSAPSSPAGVGMAPLSG